MARMQHTPRYPIGTRVSKYFPGYKDPFAGIVDDYSAYSHFYHITYEDGDSEEMTEEDLRAHVIREATVAVPAAVRRQAAPEPVKSKKTLILSLNDKAPKVNTSSTSPRSSSSQQQRPPYPQSPASSPRSSSAASKAAAAAPRKPGAPAEEATKLIGLGISKLFIDDDGRESVVNGTVSSYFIATRKYRVLFFNGRCEDLSYQDVMESIPLSSPSDEESKKRKLADGVASAAEPSASPKKLKALESSNGGTAAEPATKKGKKESDSKSEPEDLGELSPPFDSSQGLTKTYAHNITRSVLYVVVSTSSTASADDRIARQLEVLSSARMKPKKALAQFVEEGGLATLQGLLSTWSESKETETGMLVILKILAVLPGVTTDAVLSSQIGRMLTKIWKQGVSWGFDDAISEVAGWIVKKWKNDFAVKKDTKTALKAASSGGDKDSSDKAALQKKEKRAVEKSESKSQQESSAASKNGRNSSSDAAQKNRSNSVNHLRDLMGSRGKRDVLGSALGSKKRLGPAYAHRARRTTVVLDAVVRRVTENETIAEAVSAEKAAEEEEVERPSRIRFAEPTTLEFEKDVEVSRLLTVWGPMGKRAAAVVKPAPTSSSKPLKSILRVRLEPVQRIYDEPDDLVAPPVVQTVSVSGHANRHLDLSGSPSSRHHGEVANTTATERGSAWAGRTSPPPPPASPQDDEMEAMEMPGLLFSTRKEQTNRSPPPDFDERLSFDDGSILSLSPGEVPEDEDTDDSNEMAEEQQQQQQQNPVPLPPVTIEQDDMEGLDGALERDPLPAKMEQDAAVVVESVSARSE